jgi:N6-L-threonylcarbamoyladenine synthase
LAVKTISALERSGYDTLVVGGGVASNGFIRNRLSDECGARGIRLCIPPPVYCTDNAAMIACAAYYAHLGGRTDGLDIDAKATLELR